MTDLTQLPAPSENPAKRLCTVVGASATALGAITLLAAASDTVWEMRWFVLKLVALVGTVTSVLLGLLWCGIELFKRHPKTAVLLLKAVAALLAATAFVIATPGWIRILGFPAYGLAPLGSLAIGIGGLALGLGLGRVGVVQDAARRGRVAMRQDLRDRRGCGADPFHARPHRVRAASKAPCGGICRRDCDFASADSAAGILSRRTDCVMSRGFQPIPLFKCS